MFSMYRKKRTKHKYKNKILTCATAANVAKIIMKYELMILFVADVTTIELIHFNDDKEL